MNRAAPPLKLWFKILSSNGQAVDESGEIWSLPKGSRNGDWTSFSQQAAPKNMKTSSSDHKEWMYGTWLLSDPKSIYSKIPDTKIYVAQWQGEFLDLAEGMIWVSEVRLLRQATNLDLRPFGIHRSFQQIL